MFGLENQKKGKKSSQEFVFELEKEFKDLKQRQVLLKRIDERIQQIKEVLRSGENKDKFDHYSVLLYGYAGLQKVLSRLIAKK